MLGLYAYGLTMIEIKEENGMAQDAKALVEGKFLEYLDKPLVREENTICYGDMNEKCILILEIMSYKKVGDKELPDDVLIQVIDSKDPNKILKQGMKKGLHDSFSIGLVWLDLAPAPTDQARKIRRILGVLM